MQVFTINVLGQHSKIILTESQIIWMEKFQFFDELLALDEKL